MDFILESEFQPAGDQPKAIDALVQNLDAGKKHQTLLGVTGSGKTFTIANVIERTKRPTLVISPNKTLAAQLYGELKSFFPNNAVEFFVSYYDYYQPEAYLPQTDVYIEKDASINEEIDRLRLATTTSLMSRRDVIVVASVSSIYGLGSPKEYHEQTAYAEIGMTLERDDLLEKLINIGYERNDYDFSRGKIRVRGDIVEVYASYEKFGIRIEFFGDQVDRISDVDPLTGVVIQERDSVQIFPAKHYVAPGGRFEKALIAIKEELEERLVVLRKENKILEAQRLEMRTKYDLEMLEEIGYCNGIENYSRHFDDRAPGTRPFTLFDYFPEDFLLVIDESHVAVSQIRAMYNGDRSRKTSLVDHGFRLPSALDNRPMTFEEYSEMINQVIYVSATPADYELEQSGEPVEQILRPTGLIDPEIEVRPATGQVNDLLKEIQIRAENKERVLVTTLTKRLAEDLAEYVKDAGLKCEYLHSDVKTIQRVEILRDLRAGIYDALIGVNLLREGLDLPEVTLVAILDADREGFLRSEKSLIQTIGRCARNVTGKVILYADKITKSMDFAMKETERRRKKQNAYNKKHGIKPETIQKAIQEGITARLLGDKTNQDVVQTSEDQYYSNELVYELTQKMKEAADNLQFEVAAEIRDKLKEIEDNQGVEIIKVLGSPKKKKS